MHVYTQLFVWLYLCAHMYVYTYINYMYSLVGKELGILGNLTVFNKAI